MIFAALATAADRAPPDRPPIDQYAPWAAPHALPQPIVPTPADWSSAPVAWTVHPTHYQYGLRYQEILAALMGGTKASSVFGPNVAQADAHWRMVDATGEGLSLTLADHEAWRDSATAGALLAVDGLFQETLQRAPVLHGVYLVGDSILSPSVDLRPRPEGLAVVHRAGGPAARALERAESELNEPVRGRAVRPSLATGLQWQVRDADAPKGAPLLRYTAWLQLTEIAFANARFEFAPLSLAWTATIRRDIFKRVSFIASARSDEHGYQLSRMSGGVMWIPPIRGSCNIRFERIVTLIEPDERWMLNLRCENRTRAPGHLAPTLGDRGRPGPTLPWVPDRGPNELDSWGRLSDPELEPCTVTSTCAAPR